MELPVFNVADENAEKGSAASRLPFGSDLGSVVVIFAAMGESQRVVRANKRAVQHVQAHTVGLGRQGGFGLRAM